MLWRFTYATVCTRAVLFLFHWLILFQVPRSPWSLGEMSNHYPALSVSNLPSNADQGPTRPSYFRENIICPVFPTFLYPRSLVCSLRCPHWKQRTCPPLYFYLRLVVFFVWQNEVGVAKPHFWAWTFKGLEASLAFVVLPSSWEVPAQATLWSQTEEERLKEQNGPCQDQARGASCRCGSNRQQVRFVTQLRLTDTPTAFASQWPAWEERNCCFSHGQRHPRVISLLL